MREFKFMFTVFALTMSCMLYAQSTTTDTITLAQKPATQVAIAAVSPAQVSPTTVALAVPATEQKVTVYGFVRNDVYVNSRRNLDLRDGILSVYPLDATNLSTKNSAGTLLTPNVNSDHNDIPQLGYSAIFTRLGVKFGGINALGANASGMLETDFLGVSQGGAPTFGGGTTAGVGTESLIRLRHAFVKLDWTKSALLIGQFWNPNFIPKCFPGTAGVSTGIPFNPFSFVPQIRFEYKFSPTLMFTAITCGYDVAGFGPVTSTVAGVNPSIEAVKYSTTPSFAAQLTFENKTFLAGAGLEFNTIRPRSYDNQDGSNWVATPTVTSIIQNIKINLTTVNFLSYAKLTTKSVIIKAYATYGQSYTQYVGLGGFAEYRDVTTGEWKYVAQNQLNLWSEFVNTSHAMFQPAIFIGYAQNLGLSKEIVMTDFKAGTLNFYGRGISTGRVYDNTIRFAPRLDILSGKLKLSLEYEFSSMKWADVDGSVKNADGTAKTGYSFKADNSALGRMFDAVNHKMLFLMIYNF